ncbi:DUF4173 domain-containing protein [Nocardia sp. NPDC051463]|uniref:DUF4153 domain-containing protein n=1 Tax=Nocardia sp. NPDC051463 TaxID=3154845 RepID=UPI00344CBE9D
MTCPSGVLPAAAIAGVGGAVLIPLDRPGVGWVLAGAVVAAAVFFVDRRARRTAGADAESAVDGGSRGLPAEGIAAVGVAEVGTAQAGHRHSSQSAAKDSSTEPPTDVASSGALEPVAAQDESAKVEAVQAGSASAGVLPTGLAAAAALPTAMEAALPTGSDAAGAVQLGAVEAAREESTTTEAVQTGSVAPRAVRAADTDIGSEHTAGPAAGAAPIADEATMPLSDLAESTSGIPEDWGRIWWSASALALLAVGAFRAAGWLFVLCALAACVAGSLAAVGRRSANGVWYDVIAVPIESFAALPWVYAAIGRARRSDQDRSWRVAVSVAVTVVLLAVFVPLLGGADATFANLLASVTPEVDAGAIIQWTVLFAVVGLGTLGAMYLLAGPPATPFDEEDAETGRSLQRLEWVLPVGALTALFALFVGAQFVALFGGDDYVQRTAGLTYAEYARSGFWQLSIVTMLTLAIILVVLRWAAKDSAADRLWLRTLLCAVSVLSLVIVASALGRMWTYQQAYGFTVLRLLVEVCELWLGLVYLLVIAAVLRLDRAWLPRAAIGTATATLVALAVLNPEGLIADKNIDRWQHGKSFDAEYLSTLSPDIVPALERLPEPLRAEVLDPIRADLDGDNWQHWNLSRAHAR